MTIAAQMDWKQLAGVLAGLAATAVLFAGWSVPARSIATGPEPVQTFAFVARADDPVDALAASSAAGQLGAPVYLTFPDQLDDQAAEGLRATNPEVVVLAGGPAALSEMVEQQIAELLPDAVIRRFGGDGRTETAKLVNGLTAELGISRPVLAGATVTGDVGIDGQLIVAGVDVNGTLRTLTEHHQSHEIVTSDRLFSSGTTSAVGNLVAVCPDGKRAVGGGGSALVTSHQTGELTPSNTSELTIAGTYPSAVDRWVAAYTFSTSSSNSITKGFRVFAVCTT